MTDVPIREPWIPTNCVKAYAFTRGRSFTDIFGRSSRAWVSYSERRARALRAVGRLSPGSFFIRCPVGRTTALRRLLACASAYRRGLSRQGKDVRYAVLRLTALPAPTPPRPCKNRLAPPAESHPKSRCR